MSFKSVSNKYSLFHTIIGVVIGALVVHYYFTNINSEAPSSEHIKVQDKPLYWVAPMDDNYRRDKPGKSPMGMDLVPVYSGENQNQSNDNGTITINPHIINNLGVRLMKVGFAKLNSTINTVGYITYNQDTLVHIHPRMAGWVEKLHVKATGNVVKKGQPLYELYSPELVNAQEEYLLTLSAKDNRLINAAESRLRALHIPEDAIRTIKETKQVKQSVMFTSPQSGIVKDLNVREGFYVELGTKLFSIGDLSQVWVEAEVFERQFRQIHQGDKVLMSLDYLPSKQWHGEVDYINPILDEKTRTVGVRLRFENTDQALKPNMFAQVAIYDDSKTEQILIPKEALIRTGKQNRVVLALGDGRFKSIAVKIGDQDNQNVEVLEGLKAGDEIVTSAQFLIDSESSKTSDFIRIDDINLTSQSISSADDVMRKNTARVTGKVNAIDKGNGIVNITRSAIKKWNRDEAIIDFTVDNHSMLELLSIDQSIDFTFEIQDDNFVIVELHGEKSADSKSPSKLQPLSHESHLTIEK